VYIIIAKIGITDGRAFMYNGINSISIAWAFGYQSQRVLSLKKRNPI